MNTRHVPREAEALREKSRLKVGTDMVRINGMTDSAKVTVQIAKNSWVRVFMVDLTIAERRPVKNVGISESG